MRGARFYGIHGHHLNGLRQTAWGCYGARQKILDFLGIQQLFADDSDPRLPPLWSRDGNGLVMFFSRHWRIPPFGKRDPWRPQ